MTPPTFIEIQGHFFNVSHIVALEPLSKLSQKKFEAVIRVTTLTEFLDIPLGIPHKNAGDARSIAKYEIQAIIGKYFL